MLNLWPCSLASTCIIKLSQFHTHLIKIGINLNQVQHDYINSIKTSLARNIFPISLNCDNDNFFCFLYFILLVSLLATLQWTFHEIKLFKFFFVNLLSWPSSFCAIIFLLLFLFISQDYSPGLNPCNDKHEIFFCLICLSLVLSLYCILFAVWIFSDYLYFDLHLFATCDATWFNTNLNQL